VIHDWRINESAVFGVGALVQQHFASDMRWSRSMTVIRKARWALSG
jgi:hypothetical protein